MNAVTTLADRVASLVPILVPAGGASAVTCQDECRASTCNEGDFFISGMYRCCSDGEGAYCTFIGCC
jgi:hypothetical protein